MAEVLPRVPEGVQIRYFGDEPGADTRQRPLVLVNGIGAGVDNWGRLTDALKGPTYAVDVAGARTCEDQPKISDYSDALVETIDAIDAGPVDLLGISWGGALAMDTARLHGDRVHNLVLGVTTYGMGAVPPKLVALRGLMSADRSSKAFYERAPRIYGGDIRRNPGLLKEAGITRSIDPASYGRQKQAVIRWSRQVGSSLLGISHINSPTLILAGEDDPIIRPANAHMMALFIRDSELRLISGEDGGGHLLLHTRPEKCAAIIEDFLAEHG